MKKIFLTLLFTVSTLCCLGFETEMKTVRLFDGEEIIARLCLPENPVQTIVVVIHGTGPNTYLNKRSGDFVYYDILAEGFCRQGVGFYTYNRRGVEMGDAPPMFDQVDSAKYSLYTPQTEARDIESMVQDLRSDPRFENCRILLYGISEGTIIAPLVAERNLVEISGLLLHGYAHENIYDIVKWQNEGHGVMIMANQIFDKNKDGVITPDEYESEDHSVKSYRKFLFQDLPFDTLDLVKDGKIDQKDIYLMRMPYHEQLMQKISEEDDYWIRTRYLRITTAWFRSHFALEPNKSRLLRLDLPIHIFHGTEDANVSVETVYDIEKRFQICQKANLTVHIFPNHNHDLNVEQWMKDHTYSEGLQKIFQVAGSF